jgi:hypothetical protein
MAKKVLSVVANPNERTDGPLGYGLVSKVEKSISAFLEEVGGTEVSWEMTGTVIDPGAGSAQDAEAVFGRTLVVLEYEPGAKKKKK